MCAHLTENSGESKAEKSIFDVDKQMHLSADCEDDLIAHLACLNTITCYPSAHYRFRFKNFISTALFHPDKVPICA